MLTVFGMIYTKSWYQSDGIKLFNPHDNKMKVQDTQK